MALYGYDVSSYQKVGTGDSAKNFLICKATEGTGYVDKLCDQHYQRAKKKGKLLGFYHFARPDLNKGTDGAKKEAQYFYNNCKNYFREAIPALDWEQPGTTGQVSWAKAWLDEVYRLSGVRPLIYMSASVVNGNNWSSISGNYGLWIAGYPSAYNVKNPPTPTAGAMPYKIGSWKFWAIWQYSSGAGTLDYNIANMDTKGWKAYACVKATTTTTTTTPAKTEPKKEEPAKVDKKEPEPVSGQQPSNGASTGSNVPEQPQGADTGLTTEEWNKIIEKAQKTVELAENTAKKYGVTIPMSNKVYDVLKIIVAVILPVISTLYIGLANIWGFGFGEQVDKTIQLIIAAINALLGMAIVKSSSDYHKGE
jgi:GH25 family lysozyme M1 (1,4-beta-N-acetylmuramidase)